MKELELEKQYYKNVREEVSKILDTDRKELDNLIENKKRKEQEDDRMLCLHKKYTRLSKAKSKLYFSRIDVDGKKYYIGKTGTLDLDGKILITDWRSDERRVGKEC